MTALSRHAARVHDGSLVVARRYRDWLGCHHAPTAARRLALTATTVWLGTIVIDATPAVMWPLTVWWCRAAWKAEGGNVVNIVHEVPRSPCAAHRAVLLTWLEDVTRGRSGIHLAELYTRLRHRPALTHLTDAQLRACLDHYAIPVRRSIRVDGVAGRTGIHRTDIETLLAPPPPVESGSGERGGDAGQDADSPPLSTVGERAESA